MIDVLPEHVRAWLATLLTNGVTAATIARNQVILSAIFTTTLNDQITFVYPGKGMKTPPFPVKPRVIITPEIELTQEQRLHRSICTISAEFTRPRPVKRHKVLDRQS
ncbi:MAG: hypothetical protein JO281_17490 [Pseudonocardiales bacterium]|nr:hypothetical protein [Pseudonocardiales bacterium]